MGIEDLLLGRAGRLFDAAGIARQGDDSFLILGLVSGEERDLDDFLRDDAGNFRIRGFEIHIQPRLDELVSFAREHGLPAGIVKPHGYPRGSELNLKQQAVAAGLGGWGKNAVLLHPQFGPWLRLAAIRVTGTPLAATGPGRDNREENALCRDCNACIESCPVSIIEPYYLRERSRCVSNISTLPQKGKLPVCNVCLEVCPAGR